MEVWVGLIWLITEKVVGSYEHDNIPLGSIKGRECVELVGEY